MKILRYIKVEDYTNGEREYIAWRNAKNGGITKGIGVRSLFLAVLLRRNL